MRHLKFTLDQYLDYVEKKLEEGWSFMMATNSCKQFRYIKHSSEITKSPRFQELKKRYGGKQRYFKPQQG